MSPSDPCSGADPLSCPLPGGSGHHCRSPVLRVILCVHAMPITPASGPAFTVGLSGRPCQPSPISGRLGARIVVFEAFSGFTRVTACTLASPPKEDNCPWSFDGSVALPAVQVATGVNRLFPGPDFHRLEWRTFARRPRYPSYAASNAVILPRTAPFLLG